MNECEIFMAALERESILDRDAFLTKPAAGMPNFASGSSRCSIRTARRKACSSILPSRAAIRSAWGKVNTPRMVESLRTNRGRRRSNRSRSISLPQRKSPIRSAAWGRTTSPRSSVAAGWVLC